MKINEPHRITNINAYRKQQEARTSSSEGKRLRDEVRISDEAKEMLELQRGSSPERAEKLEQLRNAVSTGTYRVDAGKIADKLLPFLTE